MTGSCQREFALQVSSGAAAAPFDALKLQKLPNNRDKKQAKPAGSSCSPSAEGSRIRSNEKPASPRRAAPPVAERAKFGIWVYGSGAHVVRRAHGHDQQKEKRKAERKAMLTKQQAKVDSTA